MSLEVKLDNGILIDCIVYDEEGLNEPLLHTKSNSVPLHQTNQKENEDIANSKCCIIPLDPADIKFGEIFLSNEGAKLYFICYFCSKSYYKIQNYVQHCVEDHDIDSWKVFNFLQDKKKSKGTLIKAKHKTIMNKCKRIEKGNLKEISDHDHTYDKNIYCKILDKEENKNFDSIETIKNLEYNFNNTSNDLTENAEFEEIYDEYEYINEEYLEGQSTQELIENSDDSTDFEDPPDLTKLKHCVHCLTEVVNFKLHMRIKHFDLLYKCKVPCCYELFLTEKRLQEHITVIHRDPQKPFACKNCDYKTNKKGSLDVHFKRIHLNIRNKKCSYCEKTFYDSGELKKHERVHTGERPAMCYICGKGLRTTQDLNKHILRDHGEPTFGCKVCGKKFHLKETLLKHNFVHSNERPHICHVCGKGFKHFKYLREHMDLHSSTKKYECKICGKRFAQKNNYTGHQKIHNKNKSGEKKTE